MFSKAFFSRGVKSRDCLVMGEVFTQSPFNSLPNNPGFSLDPEYQVVASWAEIPKSQREITEGQNYLVIMERCG